jgi:hypothetical protein
VAVNQITVEQDVLDKWHWKISSIDDAGEAKDIARSPEPGYNTREQAVTSLFTMYLGEYDSLNFGNIYSEFQANQLEARRAKQG